MTNTTPQTLSPSHCVCPPGARAAGARNRRRWFTVLAVMAAATATWGALHSLLHIDLAVRQGGRVQHVESLTVTLTSLVVGLAGWLTLTLLERRTERGLLAWRLLAGGVLLVSLTGPAAAVTLSAGLGLLALHLVVGLGLLLGLPGRRPAR
ncbi:MAG TPA: DUF6069 family protein [Angustibacter sp.]|nr:DUF6069 family protein [Angustibacter sp.]